MLTIEYKSKFKQDYKRLKKRHYDMKCLNEVIGMLANEQELPAKYHDHSLTDSREYKGVRECHIKPDWLLVYKIDNGRLVLELTRTGTHSDLFR